ncbi:unnamed protein product [Spirodela intermedia]|uniref:Bifunctional inhibitor/plant lipid transfer protein/seed storage helical domain-containing protein n=1 Tax=Spirodela intermedia TaxID=51605 RepID=A0A7I8LK72_SPIIN|nr:unnamed protein product [Spirodela intermedia]
MRSPYLAAFAIALAALLLLLAEPAVAAPPCVEAGLAPCDGALETGSPSSECCAQLRLQQPCLCGYMRNDPKIWNLVHSPNGHKVAAVCGFPFPSC